MNTQIRAIITVACAWPSYGFLAGLVGATPIGVLALAMIRISMRDYVFLSGYILLVLSAVSTLGGLQEAILLCVGPAIYLVVRNIQIFDLRKFDKIVMGFILLLIADACVMGFSGMRGGTFITLEPSHSARFFFGLVIFRRLVLFRSTSLLLLLVVLFANKSMFAFVFLSGYCFSLFLYDWNNKKRGLALIVTSVLLSGLYYIQLENRFIQHLLTMQNVLSSIETPELVELSSKLGTRRATQALGGFILATPSGHGLGTSRVVFSEISANSDFDVSSISRIADKGGGPSSYFSQVWFELGYIRGILLLLLLSAWFRHRFDYWSVFSLILLAFTSTTTMPTAWLILASSHRSFHRRSQLSE
jgi:hypothetical protein